MILHLEDSIKELESAIVRIPDKKIVYKDNNKRMDDFCVFILTYGRPTVKTLETIMQTSREFNQDYYFICSDDDKYLDEYIEKFEDRVIVFNKESVFPYVDTGDNLNKTNIVVYARNMTFTIARKLGYRYFLELDDDYDEFRQRMIDFDAGKLKSLKTCDLDRMCRVHLDFLKNTNSRTISMSQMGDYIGGIGNSNVIRGYQRKVMNAFFCDTSRPFFFDGTINEDVNYYVQAGRIGILNFNLFGFALNQGQTQKNKGGLTEHYLEGGTYLKSFYSVMFCPSSVKVGILSHGEGARMHHRVNSNLTYPMILDEKYKHNTYHELQPNDDW